MTAPVTLNGIPNCDTVRKARRWLTEHGVAHRFHDLRAEGIDRARLDRWADTAGWEVLLNRAGTTFRGLPADERADLDRDRALALMLAHPAVIKRPVLEHAGGVAVGFSADRYATLFETG